VEVLFKRIMLSLGAWPLAGLSMAILLIGLFIFYENRRKGVPVIKKYFGWMIAESAVYAVVLALVVGTIVGTLFGVWGMEALQQGAFQRLGFFEMLTLSIGAGLYEEFFFRLLLVGGLFWLFRHFYAPQSGRQAYILAAVVGALVFSAVHYVGAMGDTFTLPSFTFRFLMGLALNAIFLLRGFGIAAWSHSLYDILVTLMSNG
jgi:membrane protease YdiL (CAAX protease family)